MQQESESRSNRERTEATRAALVEAARRLFVDKGYAETGTPEIVAAAHVTRGALYHHFDGKAGLFLAVARQAAEEVAREIERGARNRKSPLDALIRGGEAYFAAMGAAGRARLLLLEAPTVLTPARVAELSDLAGAAELRQGLEALIPSQRRGRIPLDALTTIVSASFDRAALAIANGEPASRYKSAMRVLLQGLAEAT